MFDHQLKAMVRESEERILHAIHEAKHEILKAIHKSNHGPIHGVLKLGKPVPQ